MKGDDKVQRNADRKIWRQREGEAEKDAWVWGSIGIKETRRQGHVPGRQVQGK